MSVQAAKLPYKRTISDPPNGYVTSDRAQASVEVIYSDMLQSDTGISDLSGVVVSDPLEVGQTLTYDGTNWVNSSVIDGGGPA